MEEHSYTIVNVGGHWNAYDNSGEFVLSGDTYLEVYNDIKETMSESLNFCDIRKVS